MINYMHENKRCINIVYLNKFEIYMYMKINSDFFFV